MLNRRYLHKPPSLWVRNGKKFFTEKILNKNISHNRLLSPVFLQNIGEEMVLIVICPDSLPSSATYIFRKIPTVHIITPIHLIFPSPQYWHRIFSALKLTSHHFTSVILYSPVLTTYILHLILPVYSFTPVLTFTVLDFYACEKYTKCMHISW